jgi:hypothetical protein
MEPKETVVFMQRLGKHVPATNNAHTTIEEFLGPGVFYAGHVLSNTCTNKNLVMSFDGARKQE